MYTYKKLDLIIIFSWISFNSEGISKLRYVLNNVNSGSNIGIFFICLRLKIYEIRFDIILIFVCLESEEEDSDEE